MADLEAFVNIVNEDDPAADFLAREQNVLAELDDEFSFKCTNGNTLANGEADEFEDDDMERELNNIDEMGRNSPLQMRKMATSPSPTIQYTKEQPEPEKLRKWREEQTEMLERKDTEESRRKEELSNQAKTELEEWYIRYADQLEKSKLNNRNMEKEWIAERDREAPGQEWEKITKLCDFNPKSVRNSKDTSRMRSILLQLKQAPPAGSSRKSSATSS